MSEIKAPVMFIEWIDQRGSGFVMDGTAGTPQHTELKAPSVGFIPNKGYRRAKSEDGKFLAHNEEIRWIAGENIISVAEQKKLNILPNPISKFDKIPIEKGYATIVREGSTVGLYDFIHDVYYNENAPMRSEKATKLIRVIELDKQTERINENEMIVADALRFVNTLYLKKGKKGSEVYEYQTVKIDGLCELFSVVAESPAQKINALINVAKFKPEWFMEKASIWEQTTETEVTHALQLNIIKFDKNTALYSNKDKIIKNLAIGNRTLNKQELISELASFLRTKDGHETYMELKAEIEAAQEKTL